MVTKITNLIRNKYLNILCYGLSILFFIYALATLFVSYSNEIDAEKKINAMLEYCNSLNYTIANNKNENETTDDNDDPTQQIYFDGKTALLQSYKKSITDAKSFEIDSCAKVKLNTVGSLYVDLQLDIYTAKYNDNKIYEEVKANIIDTNLSEGIIGDVKSGLKKLYKDGKIVAYRSKKVGFKNNRVTVDYSGATFQNRDEDVLMNKSLYNIIEENIINISYFKIKKSGDNIKNYFVQAEINQKSAEKYGLFVQNLVSSTVPSFNKILITVIIDNKGYITSFNISDSFDLKLKGFDANATSSVTYVVKSINKEPNIDLSCF